MALPSNTLATYRLECRRLLHDATGKFWSNTELNDYINDARFRVASDTGCLRRLITAYLSEGREVYEIGSLTGALVTAGGTGYTTISIAVVGDGAGATAVGTLSTGGAVSGGVVSAFNVTDSGLGYLSPPGLLVTPGAADGIATLKLLQATTLLNGSAYTAGDVLTLVGGTFSRAATVRVLSAGPALTFEVLDGGAYSVLPGIPNSLFGVSLTQSVATSGGTGSGATLNAWWGVGAVAVTVPGSGYLTPPSVIPVGGAAVPATITATVSPLAGAGSLESVTITDGGAGYTQASLVITGNGSGAAATAGFIPATTLDILNISPLYGNLRVPLNYQPWTEFNAKLRTYPISPQRPGVWSRYGTSGGAAYLGPIPDQGYTTEFDTAILPEILVADADLDEMQYPYTTPVAYYACWKAKMKQQAFAEGEVFLTDYKREILKAQASVQMRRIPNPYAGYSGG